MMNVLPHWIFDYVFGIIGIASIIHTFFLPPWDVPAIAQFPRFQKYYRLFVYFVGYLAVAARSKVWSSISTDSGQRQSDIVKQTINGDSGGGH
jgi:hypothetical protein